MAYLASQKPEGWLALPTGYDDGGVSGATLARPALQRLLADIEARRVDVLIVYKVDRLTRALSDFARLIEIFDRHAVSFISVTQPFNTTTSMGRLTLHVLLSFAQFERELTGERIRDKIAASKQKGLWMGGQPPLGYDVQARRLIVNAREAETVRSIFRRYGELGSVRALRRRLLADGVTSKRRVRHDGHVTGGHPLHRGALYYLLRNRLYRGEIVHQDTSYPGQHEAIVDAALWDQVQARLAAHTNGPRRAGPRQPSLLTGLVVDAEGEGLTPSHAVKSGRRYRYYVSRHLITEGQRPDRRGWRLPAADLERLVVVRLRAWHGGGGDCTPRGRPARRGSLCHPDHPRHAARHALAAPGASGRDDLSPRLHPAGGDSARPPHPRDRRRAGPGDAPGQSGTRPVEDTAAGPCAIWPSDHPCYPSRPHPRRPEHALSRARRPPRHPRGPVPDPAAVAGRHDP